MQRTKPSSRNRALEQYKHRWSACTKCAIAEWAIQKVFYRGSIPCTVLFVGEAPGRTEDRTGEPFTGSSGQLLDQWISGTIQGRKTPYDYAITNTVLCRPCDGPGQGNRPPTPRENHNCSLHLLEFFEIARPKLLVLVGATARDRVPNMGIPTCEIDHPAYVLRMGVGGAHDQRNREILARFLGKELG